MRKYTFILAVILIISCIVSVSAAEPEATKSCTDGFVGGDVDGDGNVNAKDAALLLKHLAGWQLASGDVNHADTQRDGVINSKDAAKLLKYIAGWQIGRLCHDDEYVVVEESTVDKEGIARNVCKICGDVASEEKIPFKVFSVCGTDICDYRVIFASTHMTFDREADITDTMNVTSDEILGGYFEIEQVSSKTQTKKGYDHEILVGDVSLFTRDGLPDFSDGQPCYGVTEDGTVYFNVTNVAFFGEMWIEFLRDHLDIDFHIISSSLTAINDFKLELVSYNENGADAKPFCRRYDPLDLEGKGYKLVFEDDFDGDSLDWDIWTSRANGARNAGYCAQSQLSVIDGNLHITAEYREDGTYGPGWYSAMAALKKWYSRGYFESRIKCSDNDGGFWSAFWIQGKSPYIPENSQGGLGPGGCEIDIMELFGNTGLSYNLYAAGGRGSEKTDSFEMYNSCDYYMGEMTDDYHIFALEWDEDFYSFYVDGILVGHTAFADGTSTAEEEVILSLCVSDRVPTYRDYTTEMVVDYLRIYQK